MNRHRLITASIVFYILITAAIYIVPADVLRWIGMTGLIVGWIGSIAFPPYFHLTVRWWENFMGQHVMAYSCAIAFALTNTVARALFPDLPGRVEAGTLVMWLITGAIWWRIIAFRRAQKEAEELPMKPEEIKESSQ